MAVEENRAAAKAAYEGFMSGDLEPLFSTLADNVEWDNYGGPDDPLNGRYSGPDGVKEYFEKLQQELETTKFELTKLLADGDHVVALIDVAETVKETGAELPGKEVHVLAYSDGKLARWELLRQVG
jgi:ketosteroid isomerase-like protein